MSTRDIVMKSMLYANCLSQYEQRHNGFDNFTTHVVYIVVVNLIVEKKLDRKIDRVSEHNY